MRALGVLETLHCPKCPGYCDSQMLHSQQSCQRQKDFKKRKEEGMEIILIFLDVEGS